MILKSIKTEHTDEKTGFVVKRIITSEWEHLNHKIAVNNNLFSCEQKRLQFDKPLLEVPFQVHHIPFINKSGIWDFGSIAISNAHAIRQKRFYLAFQQRNNQQWHSLTFSEAEGDFQQLVARGLSLVPYPIPLNCTLIEWLRRRGDAISLLNPSQMLVPVFCSKHEIEKFEDIFNYEFENSRIIGVQCYSLNDAETLLNLMKIKLRNMKLQTGDNAPLLVGFNYGRVQRKLANVSGSFAYSCFGFDIFSDRQTILENMPTDVVRAILSKNIEEIMKYDNKLGGFNLSAEQQFWNGKNLTREFLQNVSVEEGLSPYQVIQWANFKGQQDDFDILNNKILETANEGQANSTVSYIESQKEKWSVFWKTKVSPTVV